MPKPIKSMKTIRKMVRSDALRGGDWCSGVLMPGPVRKAISVGLPGRKASDGRVLRYIMMPLNGARRMRIQNIMGLLLVGLLSLRAAGAESQVKVEAFADRT